MKAYHFLFTLMMVNYNYTCLTCDKKIKKNDIPCQAIVNKFCIENFQFSFRQFVALRESLFPDEFYSRKLVLC